MAEFDLLQAKPTSVFQSVGQNIFKLIYFLKNCSFESLNYKHSDKMILDLKIELLILLMMPSYLTEHRYILLICHTTIIEKQSSIISRHYL